jgi:hypothetical protein
MSKKYQIWASFVLGKLSLLGKFRFGKLSLGNFRLGKFRLDNFRSAINSVSDRIGIVMKKFLSSELKK